MGIALQGWQRHGWGGKPGEMYWLWRDRKGLIANPLSLAANVVFVYGLATGCGRACRRFASRLVDVTLALADSAAGGADGVRGARLWSAFRAGRAGSRRVRERAEFGRDRSRPWRAMRSPVRVGSRSDG